MPASSRICAKDSVPAGNRYDSTAAPAAEKV